MEDNMARKKSATVDAPTPPASSRRKDVPKPDQQLQRCLEGHHEAQTSEIKWMTAHNGTVVLAKTVYCTVCAKILAEVLEPKKQLRTNSAKSSKSTADERPAKPRVS
jgi:hypothetical protein